MITCFCHQYIHESYSNAVGLATSLTKYITAHSRRSPHYANEFTASASTTIGLFSAVSFSFDYSLRESKKFNFTRAEYGQLMVLAHNCNCWRSFKSRRGGTTTDNDDNDVSCVPGEPELPEQHRDSEPCRTGKKLQWLNESIDCREDTLGGETIAINTGAFN